MEAATKLVRQYHLERGEPQRQHVIARRQNYHGNTLGALSAGGKAWLKAQFAPTLVEMSHISPCYECAERHEDETPEAYGLRTAKELEAEIQRLNSTTWCR